MNSERHRRTPTEPIDHFIAAEVAGLLRRTLNEARAGDGELPPGFNRSIYNRSSLALTEMAPADERR
jgi:hypothetical protein